MILELFSGSDGNNSYPMYEVYVNYAFNTNQRGEIFADFISQYVELEGKTYLDVGAAYGGCMVAMHKKGCKKCVGIEIDDRLVSIAKENLAVNGIPIDNVFCCDILEPVELEHINGKYDFISCIDVVEYVFDIEKTLANIAKFTYSKVMVYLEVPNRYHPLNVVSDPHFGHYGITLLDRNEAIKYFSRFDGSSYTV